MRDAIRDPKTYPDLTKSHKPRGPWQWVKNAPAEKEARALLAPKQK